jgi:hypothetical protein
VRKHTAGGKNSDKDSISQSFSIRTYSLQNSAELNKKNFFAQHTGINCIFAEIILNRMHVYDIIKTKLTDYY